MPVCMCLYLYVLVSLQISVHVFVYLCMCNLWHGNIQFVSLAYMYVTKSAKCESGTTSVSIVCVYLYCVGGGPNIKLVSLV